MPNPNGTRLQLKRLKFNGYANGHGHFEFYFARTTPEGVADYDRKGAAICGADTADVIALLAMGRQATTKAWSPLSRARIAAILATKQRP